MKTQAEGKEAENSRMLFSHLKLSKYKDLRSIRKSSKPPGQKRKGKEIENAP